MNNPIHIEKQYRASILSMIVALFSVLPISCSKDTLSDKDEISDSNYVLLNIILNSAAATTSRVAIPDENLMHDITDAKRWTCDWEWNIKRIRILIFNGSTLIHNGLTDPITADNTGYYDGIKIKVPANSTLAVYAVVNEANLQTPYLGAVTSVAELENIQFKMDENQLGYLFRSGSYYTDFTTPTREFSIPMYGQKNVTVSDTNMSTGLSVTRCVARVDLYFRDTGSTQTRWESSTKLQLKNASNEGYLSPVQCVEATSAYTVRPYRSGSISRGWGATNDERVWTFYLPEQTFSGNGKLGIRFVDLRMPYPEGTASVTREFEMDAGTDPNGNSVQFSKIRRNTIYKIHLTFIEREIKFNVRFSLWNQEPTPDIYL